MQPPAPGTFDAIQLLDWTVPVALGAIAWFLRKLDKTIGDLSRSMTALSTAVAVLTTRADNTEQRVERLENKTD